MTLIPVLILISVLVMIFNTAFPEQAKGVWEVVVGNMLPTAVEGDDGSGWEKCGEGYRRRIEQ